MIIYVLASRFQKTQIPHSDWVPALFSRQDLFIHKGFAKKILRFRKLSLVTASHPQPGLRCITPFRAGPRPCCRYFSPTHLCGRSLRFCQSGRQKEVGGLSRFFRCPYLLKRSQWEFLSAIDDLQNFFRFRVFDLFHLPVDELHCL